MIGRIAKGWNKMVDDANSELEKKNPDPSQVPKPEPISNTKYLSNQVVRAAQAPAKLVQKVNQEMYRRNAELAVRNKTLALLRKLDEISLATVDIDKMSGDMAKAIATELGYDLVSIAIADEKNGILNWIALASPVTWMKETLKVVNLKALEAPLTDSLLSVKALKVGEAQYTDNLEHVFPPYLTDTLLKAVEENKHDPIQDTIAHPLRFGEKMLGLLTLSASRPLQGGSQYEYEAVNGIVGLVALALYKADIYEDLQKTTAELASANKQLKDLDKAKSEFLSIASHQLRTPLTAIRGYVSMMKEGDFGEVPEQQKPVLDILDKSATRLIELINNLLDISRIESGRLELKLESTDAVKMARELVGDLLPNAITKKLLLEFHEPTTPVAPVVVDQQRVRQVMLNFVDNAIKYTNEGKIDVYVEQKDNELIFSVKDTGKGLEPDEIEKLFNKFSRVGGASRFHTEGTGLGLYVAKQIVTEHHGEVGVESPGTGKGSVFLVKLPIEGSAKSLKIGEKASVVIKAAETDAAPEPEKKL